MRLTTEHQHHLLILNASHAAIEWSKSEKDYCVISS